MPDLLAGVCGSPHPGYEHRCTFPPGHGPVEVLDPFEVDPERGQFMDHGDPDRGAWWNDGVVLDDELEPYLTEQMTDPVFAYHYGRAEGFHEALRLPVWRRVWRRYAHLGQARQDRS